MNTLQKLEAKQLEKLLAEKELPEFSAGDTIRVDVRIREGNRERVQSFEGVCISRRGSGMNASFTVRKISYGEGVERVFPLYSPRIEGIKVVRRGSVRRAKLYYLRERRGKKARIAERTTGHGMTSSEAESKPANDKKTDNKKSSAKKSEKSGAAKKKQPAKKTTSKSKKS